MKYLKKLICDFRGTCAKEAEKLADQWKTLGLEIVFNQEDKENSIYLTDSRERCREAAAKGFICAAVQQDGDGFFDGAALVVEHLQDLDGELLEEIYCHGKGIPLTVAVTERLILREMIPADFSDLCRISRQEGMEYLLAADRQTDDFFTEESLSSYAAMVYRFYGYGLWTVLRKDGTVIGCCGLQDYCGAETYALELQYMVDRKFQHQGYGTEMCRAALGYAFARTEADTIWIRCHPENHGSKALAEKLGFASAGVGETGTELYCRQM